MVAGMVWLIDGAMTMLLDTKTLGIDACPPSWPWHEQLFLQ
jgi:hypothetical protein